LFLVLLVAGSLVAQLAQAALIGVSGPLSSAGAAPEILGTAPSRLLNSVVFNDHQQGFNERQGVVLATAVTTDQGSIAAGTRVDSHMIFLNKQTGIAGVLSHAGVTWTFDGIILGTMSDVDGILEDASTPQLGAIGSVYGAPFANRGLEGPDGLTISGTSLMVDVSMFVTQPGDWIRVVTAVDEPGTFSLVGAVLMGVGFLRRRRVR
jgi:hypothetical protein